MDRLLRSYPILTAWRISLLYVVIALTQLVFYIHNKESIGTISWSELGQLIRGAMLFNTSSIVYANTLFIALSLLPFRFRGRGWYRKVLSCYYIVVNSLLIVAANLSDAVYFRYTQKRLTAEEIFFADNENSIQLVLKFAGENWTLLLIGVALIALLVVGYRRKVTPEFLTRGAVSYIVNTLILAASLLLCIAGMRGGFTRATRPITLSNATLYTASSQKANLILSNPFCMLRTISSGGGTEYQRYYTDELLDSIYTPKHDPIIKSDSLSGRNVMIFIMESMSAEHSAYLYPELYADKPQKGFTPFLDSLMSESLTFTQMYANGGRSIQAMPAVLGSIPSFKKPFVLMPESLGPSRQLPQILADEGYSTLFFCGSERGSMGFGAYARSAGVKELYSREDFEKKHGNGEFDGYWGIWDMPFIDYAGEVLTQTQEPFFASLFTLTAHHPFVTPEQYVDQLPEGYTKIHRNVAYDDLAFREFFTKYQHEDWFSRTIFVFVADHVSSEKFAESTKQFPGNHHIIGFIHTPDGALKGQYTQPTQQIDIMPTLLGILGADEPYFAYGRDVLGEKSSQPWFVAYDSQFRVVTEDITAGFDEHEFRYTLRGDSVPQQRIDSVENRLKGMIQQYYQHVQKKSYIVQ